MLSSHLNKGNMCFLPISNKSFTCIPSWGIVDSENDMFKESQGCWGPQSDIYTRCRFINLAPTLSALSWLQNKRDKTLHLKYLPIFDNLFKRKHTYILPHPTGNTPGHMVCPYKSVASTNILSTLFVRASSPVSFSNR